MWELVRDIADVSVLLALTPEELAAKILFLMRKRQTAPANPSLTNNGMFMLDSIVNEMWPAHNTTGQPQYPRNKVDEVTLAMTEAWAWLEAQGLLIPASSMNGRNGWRVLSRRARRMESEAEFASFNVSRLLPKEVLHSKIADPVWGAFVRGEFDSAAFQAMKGVEVAVRNAAGLGDELLGTKLMRAAFHPENGQLTDMTAESGERHGRSDLFAGAMASYKNPHSHRDVNLDDPYEALEIIFLANHLLRIVDVRAKVRAGGHP